MRQGKPCQIAKQMVIAGLKWPPEVEAQVIMAKAMPRANAAPGFEGGGEEGRELVLFFFVGYGFWFLLGWKNTTYLFGKYFQTQHFLD